MTRIVLLAVATALVLSGCAVPAKPISGPQGKTAYSLKCSGMGRTTEDCYEKAGELCPAGYIVEDVSRRAGPVVVSGNSIIPTSTEYMLVTCKD